MKHAWTSLALKNDIYIAHSDRAAVQVTDRRANSKLWPRLYLVWVQWYM
jgi:hypothetical protein